NIPLIIRDPRAPAAMRGRSVDAFSEAIDVMPTILEWLDQAPPRQLDGRSLLPFLHGAMPADWRTEAHWEYDFRDLRDLGPERALGRPSDECCLAVIRDA